MKKERVFAFDLIRAFCPILIILYHFSMHASADGMPYVLPCINAGGYATTLFFMISGGALYLTYKEKLEVRPYLKKRFLGIFPLFYAIWFLMWIVRCVLNHGLYLKPWYTFPLTIIGFDGYLYYYFDTWYMVGEWFLGALIACYLLFPLFRRISKLKNAWIILCLGILAEYLLAWKGLITNQNMLTVCVSFCTGMSLAAVKDVLKEKWPLSITAGVIAAGLSFLIPSEFLPSLFCAQLQAAATFAFLFPVQDILARCRLLSRITGFLAHLSYPVYLLQHNCVLFVLGYIPSILGNGIDLIVLILVGVYLAAFCVSKGVKGDGSD